MANKSKQQQIDEAVLLLEKEGYEIIPFGYFKCIATKDKKPVSVKQQNFYKTNNPQYSNCIAHTENGDVTLLPYSKKWIDEKYKNLCIQTKDNKKLAMYKLTKILQIPWIEKLWCSAEDSKVASHKFFIGKLNSLPQYSDLTMVDSEQYIGDENSTIDEEKELNLLNMKKREKKEAIKRWGIQWNEDQLARLEYFYHKMRETNRIETAQDEDYLKKIVRISVQLDDMIDAGETSKAKQLGDLYSKYMADSKFRATDMSATDQKGGMRTISQIAEEVERDDFVPPWEKYAYKLKVGKDIVDRTIQYILNFTLKFADRQQLSEPPIDTPEEGDVNEF